MQDDDLTRRDDVRSANAPANTAELPAPAVNPKAGFSDAELRAAKRVIENEVQRVNARYAPKTR